MAKFYTLLTKTGEALHANAQITQTTVPWTHMAIGDGGGNPVVPKQEQTGLVREVTRVPITSIAPDPNNPNWMIVEAVLPNNVGGWTVRETAIMGTPGGAQCIAVGNYPDTYKPVLAEGSVREMVLRMVVAVIGAGTVNLVIDPAVAIASRGWVESLIATPAKAGLVKLATVEESKAGERNDVAVTPLGLDAALEGTGGLPRFTPYLWSGRGDAMPEGDTQSSGQQLLDLMYPTMRADVLATQFYCTEAQWQADPYKRVTHWSTGDGASWMRPPDKNGVQAGNAGAFYGVGSNPAGAKTGTAIIDAMRNITGEITARGISATTVGALVGAAGAFTLQMASGSLGSATSAPGGNVAGDRVLFSAANALPAGTTTDPTTGEFRPRTFYGIWMLRMYGRVMNPGALDAAGLNARLDMMDARVAGLEAIPLPVGYKQAWKTVTANRAANTNHTNLTGRPIKVKVAAVGTTQADLLLFVDGELIDACNIYLGASGGSQTGTVSEVVPAGSSYRYQASQGGLTSVWVKEMSA